MNNLFTRDRISLFVFVVKAININVKTYCQGFLRQLEHAHLIVRSETTEQSQSYSKTMGRIFFLTIFTLFLGQSQAFAQSFDTKIPDIPGIDVEMGKSILIPNQEKVKTALAFRFHDGRIVVGKKSNSYWSYDNGHTWEPGPENIFEKATIDMGNGEILSLGRNTKRRPDGRFDAKIIRSIDNWETVNQEKAIVDIPRASFTVTGSGGRVDGFLFHHGILGLKNGDLIASMYGNYEGDVELCAGYPAELGQRKYRTIVVFSKDKGKTWGDPVLVAYDKMLGRGIPDDHHMVGKSIPESRVSRTTVVPAVTMEGFRESDLVQAANGDLICVMRSGGRNPVPEANLFPTPLYCSRSSDNGKTWSPPAQIADRGVSPYAVTMSNGIIVCTYSRPGNWLIFSDDHGKSWKGAFQFGPGGATNYIVEAAPDTIQVFYEVEENDEDRVRATFFKVKKH
jgi:hypothetical protein